VFAASVIVLAQALKPAVILGSLDRLPPA